jgi:hypothetical protein
MAVMIFEGEIIADPTEKRNGTSADYLTGNSVARWLAL